MVLVLLLIGWKIGASFLSQSCSVQRTNQLLFNTRIKTALSKEVNNNSYSIPCAVCLAISSSCRTSNLLSVTWRWRYKLEPSHHWVTMASSGLAIQPINNRMFTWRVFLTGNTEHVMSKVLTDKQSNKQRKHFDNSLKTYFRCSSILFYGHIRMHCECQAQINVLAVHGFPLTLIQLLHS